MEGLGRVDRRDSQRGRVLIHMWTPPWQGLLVGSSFDRLLSYVRPVCAVIVLPLALMEINKWQLSTALLSPLNGRYVSGSGRRARYAAKLRVSPRPFRPPKLKSVAAKLGSETLGCLRAIMGGFPFHRDAGGGEESAKARGIAAFHAAASVTRNGGSKGGGGGSLVRASLCNAFPVPVGKTGMNSDKPVVFTANPNPWPLECEIIRELRTPCDGETGFLSNTITTTRQSVCL